MSPVLPRIFLASLKRRRLASALSLLAIALGVALGLAVQLIHDAALGEFGRGIRQLAGGADLQVIGPRTGFDEQLYFQLAQRAEVATASPVVEVDARMPGREGTLRILGIDVFRLAGIQPELMPSAEGNDTFATLRPEAVFLSAAARREFPGSAELMLQSGTTLQRLRIAGDVPGAAGQMLGVMDIAAAQERFGMLGRLTRIDLRLADGSNRAQAMRALQPLLPAGVVLRPADAAAGEAGVLSRAYRVNLTMLAAIALLTGGFLVFSSQLLSVVRRRREFAFLLALGMTRRSLMRGLLAEGAVLGLIGGTAGVALAYGLAALAFRFVGADLGAGYFSGLRPALAFSPLASAAYLLLGVLAGVAGTWVPAAASLRIPVARGLHAGEGASEALVARARPTAAAGFLLAAFLLCQLPPWQSVPASGYLAIACLLVTAVLLVPVATHRLTTLLQPRRSPVLRLATARLAAAPGQAMVASAGVVASVALAVAMAIMVSSFRSSVDHWLDAVLPADLYVRASLGSGSGFLTPADVARIAAVPGVASADAVRADSVRLDAQRPAVTLIARAVHGGWGLPLVAGSLTYEGNGQPAWISEAVADLHRLTVRQPLELPLAGEPQRFVVAGIWRDYARQNGSVVIDRQHYIQLTGDERINDLALRLAATAAPGRVAADIRQHFDADTLEIAVPAEIRRITLAIFDRTFFITYLMEAVAVLIGLFGVATTFAALSTSRRGEFGMLRHLGMARADIARLLAIEGAWTAGVGVLTGILAGLAVAWVLIEVVNRQSFHWSMDFHLPYLPVAAFGSGLVVLAAAVAVLAGRRAMSQAAVRAVREDW